MDVAIITVGDELLAGETENTNASWLGRRIAERGGAVGRVLAIPDDPDVIAEFVGEWSSAFDAVIVTGGLGGTPDDVTMEGVAAGLGRDLVVDAAAREDVVAKAEAFREANPDLRDDFDPDYEAIASVPEGGEAIINPAGWVPGCVVGNVYVLPGIPDEMKAVFGEVADAFDGDATSETVYTTEPEGALYGRLESADGTFDVAVGSYPTPSGEPARIKVTGDPDEVAAAAAWLRERIELSEPPGEE